MTLSQRSYAGGHFELTIDGHEATAFVKSVDGGWQRAQVIDDPHGAHSDRVKHMGTVEIEPIAIELGLTGAGGVLAWIQGSWNRQWGRRNGEVTHANFNLLQTFRHEFFDALITETTFPTCDASSKDSGFVKFKFLPERVKSKQLTTDSEGKGNEVKGVIGKDVKQKMWTASAFRFMIDGIDEMVYTNKIESFTIKQGVKKMYIGADRFPQIEPTGIQFPNITGLIGLQHAGNLMKWHQQYIQSGEQDVPQRKSGRLEFLSPDRKSVLFAVHLHDMGLAYCAIENTTANSDSIKRVKFELFCPRMELDGPGALGFES
jgi:hypothetical protein